MKKIAPILEILDTDYGITSSLTVSNGIWVLVTNHGGKVQTFEADNFIVLNNLLSAFLCKLIEDRF